MIKRVKYPRTLHFKWSDGVTDDDKIIPSTKQFEGRRVIATEKMDGENTSVYSDGYVHARSIDSKNHVSRDWVKTKMSQIAFNLPLGWRICGENLFAEHSIPYEDLPSYFMGFSLWNEQNICLSWDETVEYFHLLGIVPVRVIYDGTWNENQIRGLYNDKMRSKSEGYVVRLADQFTFEEFSLFVGKYVRKGHVQTDQHWMLTAVKQNRLAIEVNDETDQQR